MAHCRGLRPLQPFQQLARQRADLDRYCRAFLSKQISPKMKAGFSWLAESCFCGHHDKIERTGAEFAATCAVRAPPNTCDPAGNVSHSSNSLQSSGTAN